MPTDQYNLGFIGIGLMGKPMTLRLLNAGFNTNVWNRTPEKLKPVTDAGAKTCSTIPELVRASNVIILCLADTDAVESIVKDNIMNNGDDGKLLIDLSSIHPETTRSLAATLDQQCGMGWVDAPVSGGVSGAEQGSLVIMAGGKPEHIKICNQMIVSCNVLVIAEMISLARKAGVDAEKIPQALAGGFADSKPLQIIGPEMAADSFEPVKWRVKTLVKDLNMAVDLSSRLGSAIPMTGLAAQLMQLHGSHGYLEQDPSTLIKLFCQD